MSGDQPYLFLLLFCLSYLMSLLQNNHSHQSSSYDFQSEIDKAFHRECKHSQKQHAMHAVHTLTLERSRAMKNTHHWIKILVINELWWNETSSCSKLKMIIIKKWNFDSNGDVFFFKLQRRLEKKLTPYKEYFTNFKSFTLYMKFTGRPIMIWRITAYLQWAFYVLLLR